MKIENLLKMQDKFYSHYYLKFEGDYKIHTSLSLIFSLFLNIAIVFVFFLFFMELIQHHEFTIFSQKEIVSVQPNITFNSNEFVYLISFRNKYYETIIDDQIYKLTAYYEKMISKNGILEQTQTQLNFINCSYYYDIFIEKNIQNHFDTLGLKDYHCFTSNESIILGGHYGSNFYGNLVIYLEKCQNKSDSSIICKDENTINESLQNGWIQITYISAYIDYYNYSHPIQYYIPGDYNKVDVNLNKVVYNYFNPIYIKSQNNIFFYNYKTEFSISENYKYHDINTVGKDGILYTIYVCSSNNKVLYVRKYNKIYEILSNICGIYYGIHFILSFIYEICGDYLINEIIANNIFRFFSNKLLVQKNNKRLFIKILNQNKIIDDLDIKNYNLNSFNNKSVYGENVSSILNIKKENSNTIDVLNINSSNKKLNKVLKNCEISKDRFSTNIFNLSNIKMIKPKIQKSFYKFKITYFQIIQIYCFPCLKSTKIIKKDYEKIFDEINKFREIKNIINNFNNLEKTLKYFKDKIDYSFIFNRKEIKII